MIPNGFLKTLQDIRSTIRPIDGWLTDREASFLALLGACPTATGDILEIGSFRGRSTVVLAKAKQLVDGDDSTLVAIDPLPNEEPMTESARGERSARALFDLNLRQSGVDREIEFHQAYSYDLAEEWNRELRLLWIDGDHSYPSTKQDFDLFSPHLVNGGMLAMHDVLSRYDGCIRVFSEDVLNSPHFGAVGICGSIGWAQYWDDPADAVEFSDQKQALHDQLLPLVDYHCQPESPRGLAKLHYKLLRARVPHQRVKPDRWIRSVRTDFAAHA